jgi:hypothetical protein
MLICHLRLVLLILMALVAGGVSARASAGPTRKWALLIGISSYSALSHAVPHHAEEASPLFPDLNCDEDLVRIQAALVKTFQFEPAASAGDIVVLDKPEETTRTAILDALDRLISRTGHGDIVYVHYSGHGSLIPDPARPDGYETTIVPSDYKDDQTNEITGRELGAKLAALRKKGPAQVVFSFDCCHSGTPTRGTARVRGLSAAQYAAWSAEWHQGSAFSLPNQMGVLTTGRLLPEHAGTGYVVLSACANEEAAYETEDRGKWLGRFSYVLSEVLSQAGPQTTYQQIYDQIRARFAQKFADQIPQIDGDPNSYLLGGAAVEAPPSILVIATAAGRYRLDAGSLQGMTVGSEFAVYDEAAADLAPDRVLATAKITALDLTSADLELTGKHKPDLTSEDFQGAHAIETAHYYAAPPLTLDADSVRTAAPGQAAAILARLTGPAYGFRLVRITPRPGENADIKLARTTDSALGTGVLDLVRGDTGATIVALTDSGDLPDQIYQALQKEARYRYVVGLGLNQAGLNRSCHIELRIVPAAADRDDNGHRVFGRDLPWSAARTLHVGDYFTIEALNMSHRPLFMTVLDLAGNGGISQAWPSPSESAQTNIIMPTEPGRWVKFWSGPDTTRPVLFIAKSADQHEILKAVATDRYVSFRALDVRGPDRTLNDPLGGLFASVFDDGTRGSTTTYSVDPSAWTAATYLFQVSPSP